MAEHDLQSIAFPTLDEAQMTRLSGCTAAITKSFQDGQTLFAVGDRDMKFFVVKSGEVEIIDCSGDEPKQVVVHRTGQFTGEISHLTGAPAVVSAVARGPCEVIEISGDALRRLLNQCPEMSDIILQAFIARRQLLQQSPDFTGLRVIGSRYSADTFRVRDFLANVPKNDPKVFQEFFADDVIYTRATGLTVTKADILKNIDVRATSTPEATFEADDFTVHTYGEMAIVNFRLIGHNVDKDKPTTYFRNTGTFLKRNGKWQAVSWQATKVPEASK
jgi:CRP-like cAMP-binding protein